MWNWDNYVSYAQYNEQLLNDFAEVLASCDDIEDYDTVYDCARCVGINLNDLTENDKNYVSKKITELRFGGND